MRALTLLTVLVSLASPVRAQIPDETLGDTLKAYTGCYASVLQLRWDITVELPDSLWDEESTWQAETEADPDYLTATIRYNMANMRVVDDTWRRQTVVHELWHILTWELSELAETVDLDRAIRLGEQLHTRIERMRMWLGFCQWQSSP